jgi:hypothetical protein
MQMKGGIPKETNILYSYIMFRLEELYEVK